VTDAGRRQIASGGPWEERVGYSRAVVVGDSCWVAGTTDASPDGRSMHPGDPVGQTRAIFGIIRRALAEAGFELGDVVRTRIYMTDATRAGEVLAIHGELFHEIRPAATLVEVRALLEPSLLVEIEVDARRLP